MARLSSQNIVDRPFAARAAATVFAITCMALYVADGVRYLFTPAWQGQEISPSTGLLLELIMGATVTLPSTLGYGLAIRFVVPAKVVRCRYGIYGISVVAAVLAVKAQFLLEPWLLKSGLRSANWLAVVVLGCGGLGAAIGSGLLAIGRAAGWLYVPLYPYPACVRCDYNLTGNTSGRCPECGEVVEQCTARLDSSQTQPGGESGPGRD